MKPTFKEFLLEEDDSAIAKNWVCADVVLSSAFRVKNAFAQFIKLNKSKTPYYNFIISDETVETDVSTVKRETLEYLVNFTFKNNVITMVKNNLLIESYKELLSVPPPKAILECGTFSIHCNEYTDIKVEAWWPQEMSKFIVYDHGNNVNISLTGISDVVKSCNTISLAPRVRVTSGVLGLLKIQNLNVVDFPYFGDSTKRRPKTKGGPTNENNDLTPAGIINKYLPMGDMLDCIDELEDAGYEEYAKL